MTTQFPIADHYDVMEQLDRDVHEDEELSRSEVIAAIHLIGSVPESVFLPCFGTGRHIPFLLEQGVKRIVGVDLSPACVQKAKRLYSHLQGVRLQVGDLSTWRTQQQFDAAILLGNSFADCIDPQTLLKVTRGMTAPVKIGGKFVMDYIGENYLDRCGSKEASVWDAVMYGRPVKDIRIPRYERKSGVMTIDVVATSATQSDEMVWKGHYQKLVLDHTQISQHFFTTGMLMQFAGTAREVNAVYYCDHPGELGMIARSDWWLGKKMEEI